MRTRVNARARGSEMKEEWRKVSISDNYEVSNLGRVKSSTSISKKRKSHDSS